MRQFGEGAITNQIIETSPRLIRRVGSGQRAGAQPPNGAVGAMAINQSPARSDQGTRIIGKASEGTDGLTEHVVSRRTGGPGHIAEALDRVH